MNKNIKYTNNPNNKAKSRIIFDSKEISSDKDNLSQEGLYFNFKIDKTVDTQYHMLIVGPNDSPYSGGYYMFDCQFPDLYPFFPMRITSKTQGGDIRKHPNLYKNGKCCFSFLGTWSGPPWTACHNPKTVGISMRSVLTNNPLTNEPGWEDRDDTNTQLYEDIVRFFNVKYAVIELLENIPANFECFRFTMYELFLKNYDKFVEQINLLHKYDKKEIKSPVYSFKIFVDCDDLSFKLIQLKTNISEILSKKEDTTKLKNDKKEEIVNEIIESNHDVNNIDHSKVSNKSEKKKVTAIRPSNNCKFLEEGHCELGGDNREYIVKKYDNGSKRWVLKKN